MLERVVNCLSQQHSRDRPRPMHHVGIPSGVIVRRLTLFLVLTSWCFSGSQAWWLSPWDGAFSAGFAGTDHSIHGGDEVDLSLSGVTKFSFRIKFNLDLDFSNYGKLLQLRRPGDPNWNIQFHQMGGAYGANRNKIGIYIQRGSNSNRCGTTTSSTAWAAPTDLDIVLTWDGLNMRMYANGVLDAISATQVAECATPTGLGNPQIGAGPEKSGGSAISGSVYSFTVWSGATLTDAQVSDLHAEQGIHNNPTHHFPLNEGIGTTVTDTVGGETLTFTATWNAGLPPPPCNCARDLGFTF